MKLATFKAFDINHKLIEMKLIKIHDLLYRIERDAVILHEFDNKADAKIAFTNLQRELTNYVS